MSKIQNLFYHQRASKMSYRTTQIYYTCVENVHAIARRLSLIPGVASRSEAVKIKNSREIESLRSRNSSPTCSEVESYNDWVEVSSESAFLASDSHLSIQSLPSTPSFSAED